jgi:hypothetical protein
MNTREVFKKVKCSECTFLNTDAMFIHYCKRNDKNCYIKYIESLVEQMLEVVKAGYEMSKYVACSKIENTEEFLDGLFTKIEFFQRDTENLILQVEGKDKEEK